MSPRALARSFAAAAIAACACGDITAGSAQERAASAPSAARTTLQPERYGSLGRFTMYWVWGTLVRGNVLVDLGGEVTITRIERDKLSSEWSEQKQREKTRLFITDMRARCGAELYFAGLDESDVPTVERWTFHHPPSTDASGAYVPIEKRPLPRIERTVLFKSPSIGTIRALEVDPDGRFLLLLTLERPALYRLPLPAGEPALVADVSRIPELVRARSMRVLQHAREGRKFWVTNETDPEKQKETVPTTILLTDPGNDGTFTAKPRVTFERMNLDEVGPSPSGYQRVWVPICPG